METRPRTTSRPRHRLGGPLVAVSGCALCTGPGTGGDRPSETVLLENDELVATPSIGSLVPGYILVRPKRHLLCVGAFEKDELIRWNSFVANVLRRQAEIFGPSVVFEHGPAKAKETTGCTVDHAHWHVVPTADFVDPVAEASPGRPWRRLGSLHELVDAHTNGESYLFYDAGVGKPMISHGGPFPSQVLRQKLAERLGRPHAYDWRTHPYHANVARTIQEYLG